ncbi:protein FAM160B1-like isoform X2 [Gigantopelta aegis]|uniref:protein FAM160B1-like isoform X2 n=1 Tax=Gigantopelta aegis TaxID=1735272 RepID=UPI001B88D484|nr:protein FAM160B1-like isoform X2 [Gigantopelta aegis]
MQKGMFSKFSTLIQQAVDSFSSDVTLLEEFVYHWKSVTNYFVNSKDARCPIEQTRIPVHVEQMMHILSQEEEESNGSGTTGPCLEYVLQHKLMETLYTLGRTDHPPGMKQIVLIFFTKLLSRIKHPLLPHINVHRAVQRLVKTCGETKAAPSEKEEIEYLCTVCSKIKSDPYLINFFIEIPRKNTQNAGKKLPADQSTIQSKLSAGRQDFSLVNALLVLSRSEDARVAVKACEGLMLCASLPTQCAAQCICDHTNFCDDLAERLCELYDALPTMISPVDIDTVSAKWGLDVITEREDHQSFRGKRTLTSFISWLDYCDQLIAMANPLVAGALAKSIHNKLLIGKVQHNILQTCETSAIIATAYLTRCLRTVCSTPLLSEFCHFILGRDSMPEQDDGESHELRHVLIERCNHVSEEVCVITLKLFDILLQQEDEFILHNLVLRNLLGRSYLSPDFTEGLAAAPLTDINLDQMIPKSLVDMQTSDTPANNSLVSGLDPAAEEQQQKVSTSGSNDDILQQTTQDQVAENENQSCDSHVTSENINGSAFGSSPTDTAGKGDQSASGPQHHEGDSTLCRSQETGVSRSSDGDAVLDSIIPQPASSGLVSVTSLELPPSPTVPLSLPFNRPEVHKVVNSFLSILPEEAKSSYQTADGGYDMYLRDASTEFAVVETGCKSWNWPLEAVRLPENEMKTFFEGSFLKMLFNRLMRLLDQSYSINLLLTSVISRIVLMPHPNLHEFFLNPFLPVKAEVRTLTSVLTKVSNEIKVYLKIEPQFFDKLVFARKQLLGMSETLIRFDDQTQMEAIIVLEEFCKELSAIAFVKHHAAVTKC